MEEEIQDKAPEAAPKKNKAKDKAADSCQEQAVLPVMTFSSVSDVFAFSGRRTVVRIDPLNYKVLVDSDNKIWQMCEINPIKAKKR